MDDSNYLNNSNSQSNLNEKAAVSSSVRGESSIAVSELVSGVLFIALFGVLDTSRMQIIQERILEELVDREAGYIIVDFASIDVVDSAVAARFGKLINSIHLLGCYAILCNILPTVAQAMSETGVLIEARFIRRDLKEALREALRLQGFEIIPTATGKVEKVL